ncbi:ATP-binding protein [Ideonella sp.]|uniref:ATP-binding protein n=1 Tax=Ideonella sp. TaxID=1929293 RepID=UPI002B46045C|nr:ATP-binding protein [Ideonella sp.]HJV72252.1 ATP-binding protein [Ideonella sp.]HSN31111.1 ATP-binding protein [Ideonella sp.]
MITGPRPARSLQWRLVAGVSGAVGALWLLAALWLGIDTRHEIDELLDAHLAQSAALLVAQQAHPGDVDEDDLQVDAPMLHRYARHVAFQVWHEGRLAMRSPNAPLTPLSTVERGFETRRLGNAEWRLYATRGVESDIQVYVAEQTESRQEVERALLRGLLLPLALVLPAVALVAWAVVRAGLAPLRRLGALLAERPASALGPLALPGGPPAREMVPLLAALNQLFDRIAELLEAERRFTADAAHELRTPIAAIRAQAQVALAAADADERVHALQALVAGCDRAAHLMQQMLTLARLESTSQASHAKVDLSALAREVAADLAPDALALGQTLSLEGAELPCPVQGDAGLLAVLLRNLIDNATRYSPAGARIEIELAPAQAGRGTSLRVDDSGPGLADGDLARLGERFFRATAVSGDAPPGSGLGWSIVRRIAQAHGAAISVARSSRLGGLAVTLQWPPAR